MSRISVLEKNHFEGMVSNPKLSNDFSDMKNVKNETENLSSLEIFIKSNSLPTKNFNELAQFEAKLNDLAFRNATVCSL